MSAADEQERLRLDYAQTTDLLRSLTDVRFKLLAFVPTIAGTAVALLSRRPPAAELLAVGSLGLLATTGVALYELRNTQIHDYAGRRAQQLEERLGLVSIIDPDRPGGPFRDRPVRELRLLGLTASHDRALALVYAAAIGGWSYLVGWGALHALDVGAAQQRGGLIGLAAGLAVLIAFARIDPRPAEQATTTEPPADTSAPVNGP